MPGYARPAGNEAVYEAHNDLDRERRTDDAEWTVHTLLRGNKHMAKIDNVMLAVTHCLRSNDCSHCEACPYNDGADYGCRARLRDDIIELLKAQEPHLLTAENFDTQHDLDWSRGLPAWVEYRRDGEWGEYWGDTQDEWAVVRKDMLDAEGYRCWTGYPSQRQRNETPWEQKPPRIV